MGQYVYKTVAYGTWISRYDIKLDNDNYEDNSLCELEYYYAKDYLYKRLDKVPFEFAYEYEDDDMAFIYCKSSEIDADRGYSTYELTNLLVITDKIKQEQEEISKLLKHLNVEHEPMEWNFVAYYG